MTPGSVPASASAADMMRAYRARRDQERIPVLTRYRVLGFLSSGTYGRVYKAQEVRPLTESHREPGVYAIKKFKPDREGNSALFTGISQSAIREIVINRELRHENVVKMREVMLEDNAIFLVYEFIEHDFLQMIHHHLTISRTPISYTVIRSLLWQVLKGVQYLHESWIMHRDLKPANILITRYGVVKIADLGLARVYREPLVPLYTSDLVVVTIWYRAPELLLGARHYTPAIDLWAVGCVWGELIALRPMFKGEEIRTGSKVKGSPLQTNQLSKIVDILGTPTEERWPSIDILPEYAAWLATRRETSTPKTLYQWYTSRTGTMAGYDLLDKLLQFDPTRRLTAQQALQHPWFKEEPLPTPKYVESTNSSAFAGLPNGTSPYPPGKVTASGSQPVQPTRRGQIGVGLVSGGIFFLFVGVVLFFDATLLALGNVLFVAGIAMLIGPQRTLAFFARKQKIRGTLCFFTGMALVFLRLTFIGIMVETVGFLNLFGDFFPVILNFLRQVPGIGSVLSMPVIGTVMDRLAGVRRSAV
ncbi:[pyruvate dehydrogenase (acetyl-transferring)] kinase [Malassezia psittaci]|uniref:Cyclin-dependent kinase 8 n=1 Tax=Malassezia psittaci TaxID=1821823 RepID=A0AAF0FDS0_9BASI|nr:[pyruvate dehydrogenase (acetyl-transferring)] kinase [Malassezia psittaci]